MDELNKIEFELYTTDMPLTEINGLSMDVYEQIAQNRDNIYNLITKI